MSAGVCVVGRSAMSPSAAAAASTFSQRTAQTCRRARAAPRSLASGESAHGYERPAAVARCLAKARGPDFGLRASVGQRPMTERLREPESSRSSSPCAPASPFPCPVWLGRAQARRARPRPAGAGLRVRAAVRASVARAHALHRGRVDQEQIVAEPRTLAREAGDRSDSLSQRVWKAVRSGSSGNRCER